LDALPAGTREVCRVASAFFDAAELASLDAVVGRSCALDVAMLASCGILSQRAADAEIVFAHAVVRDAAYHTLTAEQVRELHSRIHARLTSGSMLRRPQVLAFHAERAGLIGEAAALSVEAADAARRLAQLREAASLLTHALELAMEAALPRAQV